MIINFGNSSHNRKYIRGPSTGPHKQYLFIPYSVDYTFFIWPKMCVKMCVTKCIKMNQQEVPFKGPNALEFLCVTLYADYLTYLHKKF